MWTSFWDMHSGGGLKEEYPLIFIEAPEDEATVVFYNRFGHSPSRVSCTCCGEDYAIIEYETLEEATEFHRRKSWSMHSELYSLEEFLAAEGVGSFKEGPACVIYAQDIKDSEREGYVPEQGYVWHD